MPATTTTTNADVFPGFVLKHKNKMVTLGQQNHCIRSVFFLQHYALEGSAQKKSIHNDVMI